jgi:hypothetical protein
MPTFDTTCLYSTVQNTSGQRKKFGFLPPHGRELDADEEFTVLGQIVESVVRIKRVTSRRHLAAFEAAVARGDMKIVKTPNPILQDVVTDATKMVELDNGSLTAVDACWETSISE